MRHGADGASDANVSVDGAVVVGALIRDGITAETVQMLIAALGVAPGIADRSISRFVRAGMKTCLYTVLAAVENPTHTSFLNWLELKRLRCEAAMLCGRGASCQLVAGLGTVSGSVLIGAVDPGIPSGEL